MRNVLGLALVAAAVTWQSGANALFTRCEITYRTETGGIVVEVGSGRGRALCWDAAGNEYESRFRIPFILGARLGFGHCITRGGLSLAGLGFELNDNITGQLHFNLGAHIDQGNEVGLGIRLNPIGASVGVYATSAETEGFCPSLAALNLDIGSSLTPPRYTGRRSVPPPMPRRYEEDQRRRGPPPPSQTPIDPDAFNPDLQADPPLVGR